MFSCKVLLTTAGTLITIIDILILLSLTMMIIPGSSQADLHRMNVTAGYKGVVGRTCKTDPNRFFIIVITNIVVVFMIVVIIIFLAAETLEVICERVQGCAETVVFTFTGKS